MKRNWKDPLLDDELDPRDEAILIAIPICLLFFWFFIPWRFGGLYLIGKFFGYV